MARILPKKHKTPTKRLSTPKSPAQRRGKSQTKQRRLPRPPHGFTFVPIGNVFISRHCRLESTKAGKSCREILEFPNRGKRVGLFVASDIYTQVKALEASTRSTRAATVRRTDHRINADALAVMGDVFPKMPAACRKRTVNQAYLKGSGRTGRVKRLTPEQRAKNAARAHARHCHTNYEDILRKAKMERAEARRMVDERVKGILEAWEGKRAKLIGVSACGA